VALREKSSLTLVLDSENRQSSTPEHGTSVSGGDDDYSDDEYVDGDSDS